MVIACAAATAVLLVPVAAPAQAARPGTAGTARADKADKADRAEATAQQADAAASRARARVDAQLERYRAASAQVDVGVRALSAAFAAGAAAEVDDEEAAAQQRRARAVQSAQIRAVYAAGGPAGLAASVLGATSPDEALWRASSADRVLGTLFADARDQLAAQVELVAVTRRRAAEADAATAARARALEDLQQRAALATAALNQAQATLSRLDAKARQAEAAREAARQIAAAQAAARAAARRAMGEITALTIPAEYRRAYRAAASTCPGMTWTLLAGVGQVESGHGRNNGPSSAGAIGPMQFMPRTFAAYAVDGDHDGVLDPWDPQDAIFSAAHYLCASGARSSDLAGSAAWKHAALLAYNHAEWYVDLVLAAEQAIITSAAAAPLP